MRSLLCIALLLSLSNIAAAELTMSSVFSDHMVLQRDSPIHIWGWTAANQEVVVSLGGKGVKVNADADGRFDAELPPMSAGGPHTLSVAADETKAFADVLIGEVWLCSGQSNMQWPVAASNDADLESLTAKYPNLRIITVPQVGSQQPERSFRGEWQAVTPDTVKDFSAVGYFFGRQLQETLDIPVGLIDNSWGGSAAEAWVPTAKLQGRELYAPLLDRWKKMEADPEANKNQLAGQHRPANLYNGVLYPVLGYTIRGAIWYQGESNAGRAYQYRDLFPLMIQTWRDDWKQGDFPFYWVQLADFNGEASEPGDSAWAELREAQTMTMTALPNTGEAVIINLGEASDIHPRNKQDVGKRLARWALANEYGIPVAFHSPMYSSMTVDGNKVTLKFAHVGGGMDTFDVKEPIGFTVAGEDRHFHKASARLVDRETIEVWNDSVANPVAVRYAWADNPVVNVQSAEGLPLTPFRTDDWPGVTADAK
ncbi:MAG: sialate O-acetylesterase [Planctomycetaceae bacterium]